MIIIVVQQEGATYAERSSAIYYLYSSAAAATAAAAAESIGLHLWGVVAEGSHLRRRASAIVCRSSVRKLPSRRALQELLATS
jgi:hypothetical protein